MIQYVITNEQVGVTRTLVADYSARVRNLAFSSSARGFAECTGFVPMGLVEAFALYDTIGPLRVQICDPGSGAVYDGRVEDIAITGAGVTITALGFARALSDAPYTALWSNTSVADWRPLTGDDVGGGTPERFAMDTQNRLYIAPQKNSSQSAGNIGALGFQIPDGSSRNIIGVSFDWVVIGPINWQARLRTGNSSFGTIADVWTLNANGGTQTGSMYLTFAAAQSLQFFFFFNAAAAVFAGETGSALLRITNLRVVTSTTNAVNTTFTLNRAAGANVTATVGSNARMYVGQKLVINSGAAISESVTVLSIGIGTFNATFANNYVAGNTIQAHVIYADEIAKDLVATASALNSGQLSSNTALIISPGVDLSNETYEDQYPVDILDRLAGLGGLAGARWAWGVLANKMLHYRPILKYSRVWYIDVSDLDITRLLDQLTNSVYAVYQDSNNRTLRTAATSDTGSIARYGLTRRAALPVSSTSATQAGVQQAVALADGVNPIPQSGIKVDKVFDGNGMRWPLWYVQSGDTLVIRNLPPILSTTIDRIRVFLVARAQYSFDDDTLSVEPETPLPHLDALLAKLAAGISTT